MLNARIFTFIVLLAIIPCASASSMGGSIESDGTY
ncbi:uncharacterized protein METZ01_LOCUS348443, partial [marine metagenome]